ncbi:MAG: hypothetical protein HPY70_00020 [Firmicutes bacterium]|nr:hypothetical protein [Bacillota bacterium]
MSKTCIGNAAIMLILIMAMVFVGCSGDATVPPSFADDKTVEQEEPAQQSETIVSESNLQDDTVSPSPRVRTLSMSTAIRSSPALRRWKVCSRQKCLQAWRDRYGRSTLQEG